MSEQDTATTSKYPPGVERDVRALLDALDRQRGPCVLSLNVRDAHKTLRDRFPVEHDPADVAEARLSA